MKITTARAAYIPKHFNCSRVETIYSPDSPSERSRYKTAEASTLNMKIENQLNFDVWVCFRNGTYTRMGKNGGIRSAKALVVTVDQSFTRKEHSLPNVDMLDSFGALTDNPTNATAAVKEGLLYKSNNGFVGGALCNTVRYFITEDDIGSDENGVYIEELDIVVSLTDCFPNTLHPYSEAAKRYNATLVQETKTTKSRANEIGLTFFIRIVDNEESFSKRFIKIGNNTFAIPSFKDNRLKDGVYVGGSEPVHGSRNNKARSKFYTMEEADQLLPLFKTVEEADSAPESILKNDDMQLQKDTLQFKRDQLRSSVEEFKSKTDESQRRIELDAIRLNIEKDRLRDDAIRREHETKLRLEHEARSRRQSYRNEAIETAKMIVTVAGFYFAYTKLKK